MRTKLLQSSGSHDDEAKSRKKKKENRGLEKLYGKAGTGWSLKYEQQFESGFLHRRQQVERTTKGAKVQGTTS